MKDKRSTVAVLKDGKEPVGTGFLVSDKLILTCSHVVVEANSKPGGFVRVQFTGSNTIFEARVLEEYWRLDDDRIDRDIAYLELDELPPDYIRPLNIGVGAICGGEIPFYSFGYRMAAGEKGVDVEGTITSIRPDTGYLQLESSTIDKGVSGAPVMAYDQVVVGMIKKSEDNIAFAIPADILLSVNPEIRHVSVVGPYAPRILICHDVVDGIPKLVLARIKNALVSQGFIILENSYDETQGDDWEPLVKEWVWQCDAVIVLSCQDSHRLLKTPFGNSILNFRSLYHRGDFKALNIVFSDNHQKIKLPNILENERFPFLTFVVPQVAEISSQEQALSNFVRKVLAELNTGKRIGHELEGLITTAWKTISEDDRLDVVESVFISGGKFLGKRTELANLCARAMIEMGDQPRSKRINLLEDYMHRVHTKFGLKKAEEQIILDCSFPFAWVDPTIAAKTLDVFMGVTKYKGVIWGARNKADAIDAEMPFLRRVFCQKRPLIVEVAKERGGGIEDLLEAVRIGVRRDVFDDRDMDESEMRKLIASFPASGKYVFLSILFDGVDSEMLHALFNAWPGAIPFFYVGNNKTLSDFENEISRGDYELFELFIDLGIKESAFQFLERMLLR